MKQKGVKIFAAVVLAIVLLFGIVAVTNTVKNGKKPLAESGVTVPAENQPVSSEPQTPSGTSVVTFVSVGDNLIHDGIYEQAKRRGENGAYDFSFAYARVKPIIEQADIATINQETIVSKSYDPSGYPRFNSPEALGNEVVKTGFDVVNLANNHMLDKGTKGLSEAMEFWSTREGVVKTGAYRDQQELEQIEYIERNGVKIGLVGVTQYLNGLSLPKDSPIQLILTTDEATIEKKIKAAKSACDAVLVNAHWGTEYTTNPTQHQKDLAQKMADWGADVIIGHHPHVLQPVTWLERQDGGRTLCVYSLGNFISQQNTGARTIGGMLFYTMEKENATGKITVRDVSFQPVVTHWVGRSHDVQIYPLAEYTDALAKKQAPRLKQNDYSLKYIDDFVKKVVSDEFYAGLPQG